MIKIFSAKEYRADIISLWSKCFGDSKEYIEFFLDNCPDYKTLGYFNNSNLISMLFLLQGEVCSFKCKYLYAACTDENFRKQGIMEKLIRFAERYCKDKYLDGIFLVPASEQLYSYYSKFGFIPSFQKERILARKTNLSSDFIEICDKFEAFKIRKKLLENINCFKFDDKTMIYSIEEHLFNGGKIAHYKDSGNDALLFYHFGEDKNLYVKECLANFNSVAVDCGKLFSNYSAENIYIFTPIVYNSRDKVGEYTKCGMCLPLNNRFYKFLKDNSSIYAGMYLD